jgi:hypothetical protein
VLVVFVVGVGCILLRRVLRSTGVVKRAGQSRQRR